MSDTPATSKISILVWLRNTFIAGLFVVVPVVITLWILNFLYYLVSGLTEPLVIRFAGHYRQSLPDFLLAEGSMPGTVTIPGAALVMTLLLVCGIGLVATNVIGLRLVSYFDYLLNRVPVVNMIYPLAKQMVDSLKSLGGSARDSANKQVVYIKYPALNGYLVGFLTGSYSDSEGRKMVTVFLPTAPNPITGFVVVFEESQIQRAHISMDAAWKMIVSGGLLPPPGIVPAPTDLKPKSNPC